MELTREEALDILEGGNPNWKIIYDNIIDHNRWSVTHYILFQNLLTQKYYSGNYRCGATEYQDEMPWENEKTIFFGEMVPRIVTSIIFVEKL